MITNKKYSNQVYVIKPKYHQKTGPYKGSADRCEVDRNSDLIFLLQKYQAIYYCNQSLLAIVPDLNIFVFSITVVDIISISALVRFSLLHAIYLYKSTGIRFTSFVRNQHRVFVISIITGECTILILIIIIIVSIT